MNDSATAWRRLVLATFAVSVLCMIPNPALASDLAFSLPPLDHGFQLLYNLDFDHAHTIFTAWQQSHPDDPMGPTCDAAGLLFSEFHRLGVLQGQFVLDDKKFENRPQLSTDPAVRARFNASIQKAETLAR